MCGLIQLPLLARTEYAAAICKGVTATSCPIAPLQLAAAYSVLANNGSGIKPHIVRELRNPDGAVTFQAKIDARPALKAETCAALRTMMEGVTLHGTAKKAQLEGYTAAGKTGT